MTVRRLNEQEKEGYRNLASNPCDVLKPEEGHFRANTVPVMLDPQGLPVKPNFPRHINKRSTLHG